MKQFNGNSRYIAGGELAKAVNVAIALEKPLLIKGEPGTGKTKLAEDYRAVFMGDAQMNPDELMKTSYFSFNRYGRHDVPGIVWLRRFRDRFRHTVWLNPKPRPQGGAYWTSTYDAISELFGGMYLLTPEGLNDAMKRLLVSR